MAQAKDLTGQRFGRLTVLHLADEPYISPSGRKTRRWVCQCDCGKETTVLTNALTRGTTLSCGCRQREKASEHRVDLTGRRFGRLVVRKPVALDTPRSNGLRTTWLCLCDCGNTVTVDAKTLVAGEKRSCGCLLKDTARRKTAENVFRHYDGTSISTLTSKAPRSTSKTGVRGVYWSESQKQYIASIQVRGKQFKRRCGRDLEYAKKVRQELYEEYARPVIDAAEESGLVMAEPKTAEQQKNKLN